MKGSKTGFRHTPHPLIEMHKQNYVKTLEDFCECIFPRNSFDVGKVLEAVKQKKIGYGTMQATAEELGIPRDKFNAMIRRLKDLGILTKDYGLSQVFQNKISAIGTFYAAYSGNTNPLQKALDDANEYLRSKGYSGRFEPQYETQNEGTANE